jgi:hypothetical protein
VLPSDLAAGAPSLVAAPIAFFGTFFFGRRAGFAGEMLSLLDRFFFLLFSVSS